MINNQNFINVKMKLKNPYLLQGNIYKSNDRKNFSPSLNKSNDFNNIRILKNVTNHKNNLSYYNQNQTNFLQNYSNMKQYILNQQNQLYYEKDLNNYNNSQKSANKKKEKETITNNYVKKNPNEDKNKINRGMPKKSPIPIPQGYNTGKYIHNININKYSFNNNHDNSQLLHNNPSISNMSQISGYSNMSYNQNNQNNQNTKLQESSTNYGRFRGNSNNIYSSMQNRLNRSNSVNNKNVAIQNNSLNNKINKENNNNISPYKHKEHFNNFINNNNNYNTINSVGMKKSNYLNKSTNLKRGDYLSYIIKKKNNNINGLYNNINPNNYYIFDNSVASNDMSKNNLRVINESEFKTLNEIGVMNNKNLNMYKNNNNNNQNNLNYNGTRPLTSHSHIIKKIKKNDNNILGLNSNDINISNYHNNKTNIRDKLFSNNKKKINNYIYENHDHNLKRDYSANNLNNRITIDNINNSYGNNIHNINPMVNLHIINKGQIINNNNYNNYNNINYNNDIDTLLDYKSDVSINHSIQQNRNINNNKRKKKNYIRNFFNNNIHKKMDYSNEFINNNNNNNLDNVIKERQNNHKYCVKENKIRNNSSSGAALIGELNNIIYKRNYKSNNQNEKNTKKTPTKINYINNANHSNHVNNIVNNNNRSQIIDDKINIQNLLNINNKPINKRIRRIRHFSHVGFNGEHEKQYNQDSAFLEKLFAGNNSYIYLAVCDGHGVEGHKVSGFIKKTLPKELSASLYNKNIATNDDNLKKQLYNIITDTFIKVNEKLISNETINSVFSGTTCVSVIFTPTKLICANIGDSRAVLGQYNNKIKKWTAVNLSRDHKPTEEDEARRIYKKGGRIKPFIDEITGGQIGPQRVWLKDDEVPGLAMTRSFGDRVAAIAGTICIPEIKEHIFNEEDKFLIVASDGIWEFIDSEECVNIVGKFYLNNNIEGCCKYLYNESRKRWIKEEDVVDDITILLLFFE